MKRKYLHIEIIDGELFVYSDNKLWPGHKIVDIDIECNLGKMKDIKSPLTIPLKKI